MNLSAGQLARLVEVPVDARPYYRALAGAVRDRILDGRLPVRVRMPAERQLAEALGVSRTTVTTAYDRLRGQGYLESRQGAGSWTALPDPSACADNPWITSDDDGLVPLHAAAPAASGYLGEAFAHAGANYHRFTLGMGYDPVGLPELREAVAARYTARGLATRPDQIIVTTGAQQAIHLLMTLCAGSGDPVVMESPTYPHAIDLARTRSARIVPVGVPADGRHLDLLVSAVRQSGARLAYLIPDFQNPTGHLMGAEDRAALVAACRRHDVTLIVDETWAELAIDDLEQPPPTAAFDTDGRVVSVGSASKLWWGGLRIGWVRGTAALARRLAVQRAPVDIASALFEQLAVARLFDRVEETRAERRRTLAASRAALVDVLRREVPEWSFRVPSGGGSLWVRLGAPIATPLSEAAAAAGVRLAPGPWFGIDGTLENHLRLPFTQPPEVLVDAVRRVAAARGTAGRRPRASLIPAL
ncbi:GntR family transcriptional regulator [Acrocarpospora phusangensis]|uniref:GntR family transcriptional regulator n=1 Tax=Acrocarpospora phusangensis TaxID=1070424 RepID=A0A919UNV4_9ACTN|nr:PLP-dependent aminotransferase family protein [Acrocarpospora phusangensis]GIH24723.1 GntR family transcriptional regulator [Acrocarpospora phusangensis]